MKQGISTQAGFQLIELLIAFFFFSLVIVLCGQWSLRNLHQISAIENYLTQ